jgi:NTP pyrophosphatase (non-canonical NTP hydrolase)
MDQNVKISELKDWVKKFCDERGWDAPHTAKDLAIGLVTEASELLEVFRFVPREDEAAVLASKREAIADELADSIYFILRFAERYSFDLSEALRAKLVKNEVKYPARK